MMDERLKQADLSARIERLKEHIERCGETEGFTRELQRAEAQLQEIPAVEGVGAGIIKAPHGSPRND